MLKYVLEMQICRCKVFSIMIEKRKRFYAHAKADKNVYCVFPPLKMDAEERRLKKRDEEKRFEREMEEKCLDRAGS